MAVNLTHRSKIVQPVLSNLAKKFSPDEAGYVANLIAPRVPVNSETGVFPTFATSTFFAADVDPLRGDRTPAKRVTLQADSTTYTCENYALAADYSPRELREVSSEWDLKKNKNETLRDRLLIARERRIQALYAASSNGATPSTNWDQDAAVIESDIKTGKQYIRDACGVNPNTIVIPLHVAEAIAIQQDIREILKYTVNGQQILASGEKVLPPKLWGLNVVVPNGYYVANPDAASPTMSKIWDDDVYIAYVDPSPSRDRPTAAVQLVADDLTSRQWQQDDPELTVLELSETTDDIVVASELIYKITDIL